MSATWKTKETEQYHEENTGLRLEMGVLGSIPILVFRRWVLGLQNQGDGRYHSFTRKWKYVNNNSIIHQKSGQFFFHIKLSFICENLFSDFSLLQIYYGLLLELCIPRMRYISKGRSQFVLWNVLQFGNLSEENLENQIQRIIIFLQLKHMKLITFSLVVVNSGPHSLCKFHTEVSCDTFVQIFTLWRK